MGLRGPRRRSSLPVGLTLILLGLTAAAATHPGTTGLTSSGVMASVGTTATPPTMGWNSWNSFGCGGLTETPGHETADPMGDGGGLPAGVDTIYPPPRPVPRSPALARPLSHTTREISDPP